MGNGGTPVGTGMDVASIIVAVFILWWCEFLEVVLVMFQRLPGVMDGRIVLFFSLLC